MKLNEINKNAIFKKWENIKNETLKRLSMNK